MKFFKNANFEHEISDEIDAFAEEDVFVNRNQRIFSQLSVTYSDKLDRIYQKHERLQYFHLTLENCWLSTSQNENEEKIQTLINNGYFSLFSFF